MNRLQLEHVIRAAGDIAGDDEIVILGSTAILSQFPDVPEQIIHSVEADIFPILKVQSRWTGGHEMVDWYPDNEETLDWYLLTPAERFQESLFDGCELGMKREGMSGNPPSSGTPTYDLSGA